MNKNVIRLKNIYNELLGMSFKQYIGQIKTDVEGLTISLIESINDEIMSDIFIINGKKPWSIGYNSYKWKGIKRYLEKDQFNDGNLSEGYGFRIDERIIEYPWLLSRLSKTEGTLLDAGSILNYETILSCSPLLNKKIFISTLAPERKCYWRRGVSYIFEDLRNCCYRDNFFDCVVCISTLEHIGLDNTMLYTNDPSKKENENCSHLSAVKDFHRILKPGGTLFITTPYGQYMNHGWFQVFDEEMVNTIINTFNPSSYLETHFRYLPQGWQKSSRILSKDATFFDIHSQKNYNRDFAACSRAIVCLEMIK